MKNTAFIVVIFLILNVALVRPQDRRPTDSWTWIVPLRTKKVDIERAFGSSITEDKTHPFQTYVSEFGRITAAFAPDRMRIDEHPCFAEKGSVLNYSISPRKLNLLDLGYDLKLFTKDLSGSPREITYFSEALGLLIDTTLLESPDQPKVERVLMLVYHAPKEFMCSESIPVK